MTTTPDQLLDRLRDLGIAAVTHHHPPVYTVEEARAHCGHLPGGHCKNLFLKDHKDRLWLVVALEDTRIDLKVLQGRIGSGRLSFGKPELLREVLGVEPGSVTPFALVNDTQRRVTVVLEKAMLEHDPLNYHPLTNERTTAVPPAGLLDFIAACGHEPIIADLT